MLPWAWKLTLYCKNFAHFVLLCFFGILLAQNLQHIGIFKIFHILIKAQQVLNFLTSREFQPANFLKKFLHLVHFEPQFSYKWVLIKKKCSTLQSNFAAWMTNFKIGPHSIHNVTVSYMYILISKIQYSTFNVQH